MDLPENDALLNKLLIQIDAEVLKSYDLPPRLERQLLEFFRGYGHTRPVGRTFRGWLPEEFTAYIPLHEYLAPLAEQNRGFWTLDVFTRAPDEEAATLKHYVRGMDTDLLDTNVVSVLYDAHRANHQPVREAIVALDPLAPQLASAITIGELSSGLALSRSAERRALQRLDVHRCIPRWVEGGPTGAPDRSCRLHVLEARGA